MDRTDVINSWQMVPNREPVTVTLIRSAGNVTVSIGDAWRKDIKASWQVFAGVHLQGGEVLWRLPDIQLNPADNGRELREGDQIAAGGVTFIVNGVARELMRTRWACVCQEKQ